MKKIRLTIGLAAAILIAALALFTLPKKADAQAQFIGAATNLLQQNLDQSVGNFAFKSVTLTPSFLENPSNTFFIKDSTGTNFVMVSPTNNQFIIRFLGTNSYAVLSTNIVVTNNAAQTHTMSFINGMLVNYQ